MSQLIVFEGVFDPPHIGHFWMGQCAIEEFGGHLLICPATDESAIKISYKENATPYETRLKMCEVGFPNAAIFKHNNIYTIKLIRELKDRFSYTHIILLHGPDWISRNYNEYDELKEIVEFKRLTIPWIQIRSTKIRKRLAQGQRITGMVLPEVEKYIKDSINACNYKSGVA